MMDRKKLAVVHIVKNELGLSETKYRDILRRVAGVSSAKDLTEEKFRKLMRYLVRSPHYRVNSHGMTIKQKLFIQSLAQGLGWDQDHLTNFLHKYYHGRALKDLTRLQASHAIESLKHIKTHTQEKSGAGRPSF